MTLLLQDLRHTFRACRRRKGPTSLIILTLALGIGANTAIFGIIRGVLLRPLPFRDADRLVQLGAARRGESGAISLREIEHLRDGVRAFARV